MNNSTSVKNDTRETFPVTWGPKLAEALRRSDTHTVDDVLEALECDQMQAWWSEASIVITRVNVLPRIKVLDIFAAAGELSEVVCIINEQAIPWAKGRGCKRVTCQPIRPGWQEVAKGQGWEVVGVVLGKEL